MSKNRLGFATSNQSPVWPTLMSSPPESLTESFHCHTFDASVVGQSTRRGTNPTPRAPCTANWRRGVRTSTFSHRCSRRPPPQWEKIAAKCRLKPCYKTLNKAKRASKVLFLPRPWAQEVRGSDPRAPTTSSACFDDFLPTCNRLTPRSVALTMLLQPTNDWANRWALYGDRQARRKKFQVNVPPHQFRFSGVFHVMPELRLVVTILAGRYNDPIASRLPDRRLLEHIIPALRLPIGAIHTSKNSNCATARPEM